jgi:hypothetical protein
MLVGSDAGIGKTRLINYGVPGHHHEITAVYQPAAIHSLVCESELSGGSS